MKNGAPNLGKEIGARIAQAAVHSGGKRELARRAGLNEDQIYRYIRGENLPKVDVILSIADAAGVDLLWLMTGVGAMTDPWERSPTGLQREELAALAERLRQVVGEIDRWRYAAAARVPQSTLRQYLEGSREPSIGAIVGLARAAGVDVEWLATGKGTRRESAPPDVNVPIENVPLERVITWLRDWWAHASPDERAWMRVQLERTFPELAAWQKKPEANSQRQSGA